MTMVLLRYQHRPGNQSDFESIRYQPGKYSSPTLCTRKIQHKWVSPWTLTMCKYGGIRPHTRRDVFFSGFSHRSYAACLRGGVRSMYTPRLTNTLSPNHAHTEHRVADSFPRKRKVTETHRSKHFSHASQQTNLCTELNHKLLDNNTTYSTTFYNHNTNK